jgi:predicted transcriptional regulator
MNRVEISVIDASTALAAFAAAWHAAERGQARPAKLAFGSLRELFAAITEQRLLLMRAVASQEHTTVESLADVLGQSPEAVQRDADALLSPGLLERSDDGKLTTPFDEVVIHAGIRDAA